MTLIVIQKSVVKLTKVVFEVQGVTEAEGKGGPVLLRECMF